MARTGGPEQAPGWSLSYGEDGTGTLRPCSELPGRCRTVAGERGSECPAGPPGGADLSPLRAHHCWDPSKPWASSMGLNCYKQGLEGT